jgi:S1/P1 Nuclease
MDKGGNGIKVTFDGTDVNLHHVWDTNIPEKLVGGYSLVDAQNWASQLSQSIKAGPYKSQAASWIQGIDITDGVSSSLIWAKEANAYVCLTVMPKGKAAVEGQELGTTYYETAVPVVELQIARAGYRLAAWFNFIASGAEAEELLVQEDL